MTATAAERLTKFKGVLPGKGTFPMAASITLLKGTIVTVDSSGRGDVPTASQDAVGVAAATYVNGSTAGAIDVEVEYGIFGFAVDGTAPQGKGEVMFVVDNQTVSLDGSGSRGVAGFCTEYRGGQAYVWMSPIAGGQYADPAAAAAVADGADAKAELLKVIEIPVPLNSFRLANGAAVPAFSDGVADGFELTGNEALAIRFNDDSTTVMWSSVKLPDDLDLDAPVEIHFLASRVGALDTTAVITVTAFAADAGAAYDATSDLSSGNTAAIAGATKVSSDVHVTANAATAGSVLSFSMVPSAALDADDLLIHACWLEVTRDIVP